MPDHWLDPPPTTPILPPPQPETVTAPGLRQVTVHCVGQDGRHTYPWGVVLAWARHEDGAWCCLTVWNAMRATDKGPRAWCRWAWLRFDPGEIVAVGGRGAGEPNPHGLPEYGPLLYGAEEAISEALETIPGALRALARKPA